MTRSHKHIPRARMQRNQDHACCTTSHLQALDHRRDPPVIACIAVETLCIDNSTGCARQHRQSRCQLPGWPCGVQPGPRLFSMACDRARSLPMTIAKNSQQQQRNNDAEDMLDGLASKQIQ